MTKEKMAALLARWGNYKFTQTGTRDAGDSTEIYALAGGAQLFLQRVSITEDAQPVMTRLNGWLNEINRTTHPKRA